MYPFLITEVHQVWYPVPEKEKRTVTPFLITSQETVTEVPYQRYPVKS
jgi:hypothetical protein